MSEAIVADMPKQSGPTGQRVPVAKIYEIMERALREGEPAWSGHMLLVMIEHAGWEIVYE